MPAKFFYNMGMTSINLIKYIPNMDTRYRACRAFKLVFVLLSKYNSRSIMLLFDATC